MVLITGGLDASSNPSLSAALYDPLTNSWSAAASMSTGRYRHSATLLATGKVLVAGGNGPAGLLASAQLYNPANNTWTATGSLVTGGRANHSATLLPSGKVLIAGGNGVGGELGSAELYDPAGNFTLGSWSATGSLATARGIHTATLLPGGRVLVAAGEPSGSGVLASAELYDSASGAWSATGPLATGRFQHTATLLPSGKVLVAGGQQSSGSLYLASAELYDPAGNVGAGTWSATGSLATARDYHTATLLPGGKVLVAGGIDTSAELYDPAGNGGNGSWSTTGSLTTDRDSHTATLLPAGKVLVAGGAPGGSSAEVYDPATGTWSATGSLAAFRAGHTATLLANGKVLVAGGQNGSSTVATAELYDPAAGTWSVTGPLTTARLYFTATLLPSGKVLAAGGSPTGGGSLASAELYDPASGTWSATGALAAARMSHTATLLPGGKVLVAAGYGGGYLTSAELYDPSGNGGAGSWTPTGALATGHSQHTATLLPNGKVLVAGSPGNGTSAELYDVGLGFSPAWQPQITAATFDGSGRLVLTGTLFRGISSASGGNGSQDSPTSHPVVQLRRLDNEQSAFLLSHPSVPVSASAFTSLPVADLRPGYVQVTVFANGIPSPAVVLAIPQPDIAVEEFIGGAPIADGGGKDFGTTVLGTPVDVIFLITNPLPAGQNLTGLTITKGGPNPGDFLLVSPPTPPVAPGLGTKFTLRFLPTAGASTVRVATLQIASNVTGTKNPYDINLVGQALSFTQDSDGDGMNDAAEWLLRTLGFNWQSGNTAQQTLVQTYYNNANAAGLYTPTQVQALNIGVPLIQKDVVTGRFTLTIGVQKSTTLQPASFLDFPMNGAGRTTVINGAGKLELGFTVPDDAAFFRLQSQ